MNIEIQKCCVLETDILHKKDIISVEVFSDADEVREVMSWGKWGHGSMMSRIWSPSIRHMGLWLSASPNDLPVDTFRNHNKYQADVTFKTQFVSSIWSSFVMFIYSLLVTSYKYNTCRCTIQYNSYRLLYFPVPTLMRSTHSTITVSGQRCL